MYDDTKSLVRQIAELSRQGKAAIARSKEMLRAGVDSSDYCGAVAAFQLFNSGMDTLRRAYGTLDMRNLPFDYLTDKDDAELNTFAPFNEGAESISVRDAMGVKGVALSEVQVAIGMAASLQLPLVRSTFQQGTRLLDLMVVNAELV